MNDLSNIPVRHRIGLVAAQPALPAFNHRPCPYSWDVLIHGGTCPRTGRELPPMDFRFPARRWNTGYTLSGVIERADELAGWNKRTAFAVRDGSGKIVACQEVAWPNELAGEPIPAVLGEGE